ncbi:MAG: inositol monophosphatase [Holosporales bacterium]|jgi:myo-inositol-1(or 4)-monophosphatase|nr:inositol monophosphatase [Holosporales bacterium]
MSFSLVSEGNSPVVNVMIMTAQKAAKGLIRDFGELEKLQAAKGVGGFASAADKRAEAIIIDELAKARPEYAILAEESGLIRPLKEVSQFDKNYGFRWIVDPLDGSQNFTHGIAHFAISIAVARFDEVIAGIVFNPVTDEMFLAEKGRGAFLNKQRLRVSGAASLSDMIVATGSTFGFRGARDAGARLQTVAERAGTVRHFGASSLDLAFVAAGRFGAFFERRVKEWDVSAGALLVREAGGTVSLTSYNGPHSNEDFQRHRNEQPSATNSFHNSEYSCSILASNLQVHTELKSLVCL